MIPLLAVASMTRGRSFVSFVPFVSFVCCMFLAGCEAPPARAEQPRAAVATTWRPLGTWSGRGNIQTESFDVETGALRLRWETRHESRPGAGTFKVSLYSAISGRPLQTIVDAGGTGASTAYVADDPRVSYLVIESEHVAWSASLEEAMPARAATPE